MDLRRIRHFVALAETLNFRRAAERLHMAQPPLTVSIRKLEDELGARLFDRGSGGVSLTPSGRALLAEARKLLFHGAQFGHIARSVAEGSGGTLRIGFVGTSTWGLLQMLVPRFRAEHPGVELVLREATSVAIVQQLEEHALDVGLVRTPLLRHSAAVRIAPLQRHEFVAALPAGHALAYRGPLRLAELAEQAFVMYDPASAAGLHGAAMAACQHAGFLPQVAQVAVQVQTLLALVESGLGVALVPALMKGYASERLAYRPLLDLPEGAATGLALAWLPDGESAAAARFRATALKACGA
ncbi:MAG: LysR substrate-binding domain-containing protein [Rubrivivax sp.]